MASRQAKAAAQYRQGSSAQPVLPLYEALRFRSQLLRPELGGFGRLGVGRSRVDVDSFAHVESSASSTRVSNCACTRASHSDSVRPGYAARRARSTFSLTERRYSMSGV